MARHVRLSELLVGTEGLALLRNLYDGSDEEAAVRLREVRAILDREHPTDPTDPIAEADPRAGYAAGRPPMTTRATRSWRWSSPRSGG